MLLCLPCSMISSILGTIHGQGTAYILIVQLLVESAIVGLVDSCSMLLIEQVAEAIIIIVELELGFVDDLADR